jgi:3-hydroxyisobutyrate dehydrogenase
MPIGAPAPAVHIGGTKIAFVGVGRMGRPIAIRLAKAGYEVSAYDIRQTALKELGSAPSAAAASRGADVLITCLPDADDVQTTIDELWRLEAIPALYIDLTSSDPRVTKELGKRLRSRRCDMLDAPVSGGVRGAETGELLVMVGGPRAVYNRHIGLLRTIGEKVIRVGSLGSGHRLKALNNAISGASMIGAAEIFSLAADQGLDLKRALSIINASSGRSDATMRKFPDAILSGTYDLGFDLAAIHKDMARACDIAADVRVITPITSLATQLVRLAGRLEGMSQDFSSIARLYDPRAQEQDVPKGLV